MKERGSRYEEKQIELRKRAKRGDLEFALCAVVLCLSPGFLFSLLIVWLIQRGSDVARLIGSAKGFIMMSGAWYLAFVGSGGTLVFVIAGILYGLAGAGLGFSPNILVFQAMKRDGGRPPRRRRRQIR